MNSESTDPLRASARRDDRRDGPDASSSSLASDIVELVVLTADEVFMQTLREAVGVSRRLWHVASPDKVGDLLIAGGVGIAVLDVQALLQPANQFVAEIKRQFPDLVIVVAGSREAESELARLISEGTVYRFIHKPVSPARAQLFADAAVRRYEERRQRRLPGATEPAAGTARGELKLAAGCAVIGAVGALLWGLSRTEHGAVTGPAAAPGSGAPSPERARGTKPEAPAVVTRTLPAPVARAPLKAPAGAATATPAPVMEAAAAAAAPADPAAPSVALALQRIREGRWMEPERDSARFYVQQALKSNPASEAAGQASEALALALVGAARTAIETGDLQAAAHWIDAADGIAATANIDHLRHLLAAAQARTGPAPASSARPDAPRAPLPPAPADAPPRGAEGSTPTKDQGLSAAGSAAASTTIMDAGRLTLQKSVQPEYPVEARRAALEGWVELDFTVGTTGEVSDITVHGASPRGVFEHAATRAVSQWRYVPWRVGSTPVPQRARIRIRFALAR